MRQDRKIARKFPEQAEPNAIVFGPAESKAQKYRLSDENTSLSVTFFSFF